MVVGSAPSIASRRSVHSVSKKSECNGVVPHFSEYTIPDHCTLSVPKLTNEEIDRLFDNALGGATSAGSAPSLFGSEPKQDVNRIETATPWIMSDEYATDDDEVEDILDEAIVSLFAAISLSSLE